MFFSNCVPLCNEVHFDWFQIIDKEINPYVEEWENNDSWFPAHQVFKKLGDAGLLGLTRDPGKNMVQANAGRLLIHCISLSLNNIEAKCEFIMLNETMWIIKLCDIFSECVIKVILISTTSNILNYETFFLFLINMITRCKCYNQLEIIKHMLYKMKLILYIINTMHYIINHILYIINPNL